MELDEQPDGQRMDVNLAGLRSGRPLVAVTMGDPAGVGPELCLRLLRDASVLAECQPVIFGDAGVLRRVAEALGWPFDEAWVWGGLEEAGSQSGGIWHLPGLERPDVWQPGVFTAATGAATDKASCNGRIGTGPSLQHRACVCLRVRVCLFLRVRVCVSV